MGQVVMVATAGAGGDLEGFIYSDPAPDMRFLGGRGSDFGLGKSPPALAPSAQTSLASDSPRPRRPEPRARLATGVASQVTRKMQVGSRIGVSVPFSLELLVALAVDVRVTSAAFVVDRSRPPQRPCDARTGELEVLVPP
ncbi:MAG: hypothetical protein M3P18_05615 [Actinomycetota bacterium]|nr:hypothetical protein [Actinomycetota bacterium]